MIGHTSANTRVRQPAVAGLFYPQEEAQLRAEVRQLLKEGPARAHAPGGPSRPNAKALIVPHAGYVYSGSVAAAAYAQLAARRADISRVVLIGPSHRIYFRGIALPEAAAFSTPLGSIRVDAAARAALVARGDVLVSDEPHALEHCLEVQLPFLQVLLEDFTIVPLVVGVASPQHVSGVLAEVWGGPETLVLASSDLSHYHSYAAAQQLDQQTAAAILARRNDLDGEQACGAAAINGLLTRAQQLDLQVQELARLNSGDTAGDRARVVGYGAYALFDA
ncbi:MAG: AmmeMemoRadiSam system protein B [Steroidobacterales bacterium]